MRLAVAVLGALAACATPPGPALEHHALRPSRETFVLDAPLFTTDDLSSVIWTLDRDGENAHLTLGDGDFVGTAHEDGDRIHFELGGVTMECRRTSVRVHAAATEPQLRLEHPVCNTPRAWLPEDRVTVAALACTVHRERLTTEVTMAPPPGLQAIADDCCDDDGGCQRRWEIRQRYATADLLRCTDCACFDELVRRVAACTLPDDVRSSIDLAVGAAYPNKLENDHDDPQVRCRDSAAFIVDNAARLCGWNQR